MHEDFIGETLVSPTGWLIVEHEGRVENARFDTAYEKLFHDTISTIATHDWGKGEPYFEELNISVSLPITDRRLAYDEEALSLTEALHEDIYFSLLEVFQKSPVVRSVIVACNRVKSYRKSASVMLNQP